MTELESYEVETVVQGYHVYVAVWEPALGQILPSQREGGNNHDPYTVVVVKEGVIMRHVPRAISAVCSLFLRRNGPLDVRYLILSSHARLIAKVQKLLQEAITSGLLKPCNNDSVVQQDSQPEQPEKKHRIEQND